MTFVSAWLICVDEAAWCNDSIFYLGVRLGRRKQGEANVPQQRTWPQKRGGGEKLDGFRGKMGMVGLTGRQDVSWRLVQW